jgi:hypothetical protein
MTSITIAPAPLKLAKRAIQAQVPDIKSAHLSEAIAAGLGYKSHAALKASMLDEDPDIRLLDPKVFEERAASLGAPGISLDKDWFENKLCQAGDGIYRTQHPRDEDLPCIEGFHPEDPASFDAWQNLEIASLNTMIRERVFSARLEDPASFDAWQNLAIAGVNAMIRERVGLAACPLPAGGAALPDLHAESRVGRHPPAGLRQLHSPP